MTSRSEDESGAPPDAEVDDLIDEIALRCIDLPPDQIDERLLDEMEKHGILRDCLSSSSYNKPKKRYVKITKQCHNDQRDVLHVDHVKSSLDNELHPSSEIPRSYNHVTGKERLKINERKQSNELDKKSLLNTEQKPLPAESLQLLKVDCENERPLFDYNMPLIDPFDKRTLKYDAGVSENILTRRDSNNYSRKPENMHDATKVETNFLNNAEVENAINRTITKAMRQFQDIITSIETNTLKYSFKPKKKCIKSKKACKAKPITPPIQKVTLSSILINQKLEKQSTDEKLLTAKELRDMRQSLLIYSYRLPAFDDTRLNKYKTPSQSLAEPNISKTTLPKEQEYAMDETEPQKLLGTVPNPNEQSNTLKSSKTRRIRFRKHIEKSSKQKIIHKKSAKPIPETTTQETLHLITDNKYRTEINVQSKIRDNFLLQEILIDPGFLTQKSSHFFGAHAAIFSPERPESPTKLPTNTKMAIDADKEFSISKTKVVEENKIPKAEKLKLMAAEKNATNQSKLASSASSQLQKDSEQQNGSHNHLNVFFSQSNVPSWNSNQIVWHPEYPDAVIESKLAEKGINTSNHQSTLLVKSPIIRKSKYLRKHKFRCNRKRHLNLKSYLIPEETQAESSTTNNKQQQKETVEKPIKLERKTENLRNVVDSGTKLDSAKLKSNIASRELKTETTPYSFCNVASMIPLSVKAKTKIVEQRTCQRKIKDVSEIMQPVNKPVLAENITVVEPKTPDSKLLPSITLGKQSESIRPFSFSQGNDKTAKKKQNFDMALKTNKDPMAELIKLVEETKKQRSCHKAKQLPIARQTQNIIRLNSAMLSKQASENKASEAVESVTDKKKESYPIKQPAVHNSIVLIQKSIVDEAILNTTSRVTSEEPAVSPSMGLLQQNSEKYYGETLLQAEKKLRATESSIILPKEATTSESRIFKRNIELSRRSDFKEKKGEKNEAKLAETSVQERVKNLVLSAKFFIEKVQEADRKLKTTESSLGTQSKKIIFSNRLENESVVIGQNMKQTHTSNLQNETEQSQEIKFIEITPKHPKPIGFLKQIQHILNSLSDPKQQIKKCTPDASLELRNKEPNVMNLIATLNSKNESKLESGEDRPLDMQPSYYSKDAPNLLKETESETTQAETRKHSSDVTKATPSYPKQTEECSYEVQKDVILTLGLLPKIKEDEQEKIPLSEMLKRIRERSSRKRAQEPKKRLHLNSFNKITPKCPNTKNPSGPCRPPKRAPTCPPKAPCPDKCPPPYCPPCPYPSPLEPHKPIPRPLRKNPPPPSPSPTTPRPSGPCQPDPCRAPNKCPTAPCKPSPPQSKPCPPCPPKPCTPIPPCPPCPPPCPPPAPSPPPNCPPPSPPPCPLPIIRPCKPPKCPPPTKPSLCPPCPPTSCPSPYPPPCPPPKCRPPRPPSSPKVKPTPPCPPPSFPPKDQC